MSDRNITDEKRVSHRCRCWGISAEPTCPIHGNHPSNIEPGVEEGEPRPVRWSEDDE